MSTHAPHVGSRWATPQRMVAAVFGRCPNCGAPGAFASATVVLVYRPVKGWWLWVTWAAGWVHRDGEDPERGPEPGGAA